MLLCLCGNICHTLIKDAAGVYAEHAQPTARVPDVASLSKLRPARLQPSELGALALQNFLGVTSSARPLRNIVHSGRPQYCTGCVSTFNVMLSQVMHKAPAYSAHAQAGWLNCRTFANTTLADEAFVQHIIASDMDTLLGAEIPTRGQSCRAYLWVSPTCCIVQRTQARGVPAVQGAVLKPAAS